MPTLFTSIMEWLIAIALGVSIALTVAEYLVCRSVEAYRAIKKTIETRDTTDDEKETT